MKVHNRLCAYSTPKIREPKYKNSDLAKIKNPKQIRNFSKELENFQRINFPQYSVLLFGSENIIHIINNNNIK